MHITLLWQIFGVLKCKIVFPFLWNWKLSFRWICLVVSKWSWEDQSFQVIFKADLDSFRTNLGKCPNWSACCVKYKRYCPLIKGLLICILHDSINGRQFQLISQSVRSAFRQLSFEECLYFCYVYGCQEAYVQRLV